MDLVNLFLFCLMSCVIGAVLMLLVQYYAFVKYFRLPDEDSEEVKCKAAYNEPYMLPDVSTSGSNTSILDQTSNIEWYFEVRKIFGSKMMKNNEKECCRIMKKNAVEYNRMDGNEKDFSDGMLNE